MKDVIQNLREELKKKNSEIGITTLEDMAKLQVEILTRDLEKMNAEIFVIISKDFDNLENLNPRTETIYGYVKNEVKAQSIVDSLNKQPKYKGWDSKDYPQFYYIKVEECK